MSNSIKDSYIGKINNAQIAIRYHMLRQRFYEAAHKVVAAISMIFATGAASVILDASMKGYASWFAFIVVVAQVFDFVFDTRGQSIAHNDLRRDYLALLTDLNETLENCTNDDLVYAKQQLSALEQQEPPIKKYLLHLCHNDIVTMTGANIKHKVSVRWVNRALCQVW